MIGFVSVSEFRNSHIFEFDIFKINPGTVKHLNSEYGNKYNNEEGLAKNRSTLYLRHNGVFSIKYRRIDNPW